MKASLLLFLAVGVVGCAHVSMRDMKNFEVTDGDYVEIAKACLDTVERTDHVSTIVLPPGVDRRVRAAMMRLHPVVAPDAVPRSTTFTLPENYFVLQTFEIDDGAATFEGQLGPVRRVPLPPAIDDCGRNFQFQYFLEPSGWSSQSYKISVCYESRHWVPKDEASP